MFDFNFSFFVISVLDSVQMIFGGINFMMSNVEGELIFYINGCEIYNVQYQFMENGEGINLGDVYDY